MAVAKCSDEDFMRMFEAHGADGVAKRLGMGARAVYSRRRRLEVKIGGAIKSPLEMELTNGLHHPRWLTETVTDGYVLIGSDAHYWPGRITTAHRGFVKFAKKLQPKIIIMNGDVMDGASISRHPSIGWEDAPSVVDEITACQERLSEIQKAAPNARRLWPLGNHDSRFESRLAAVAPEFAKVEGIHLKDHFPYWEGCWSVKINDDVVVKHRHKNGIHAVHNATMWAGKTMITGHLHSMKVSPFSDYNGTRYGVDTGTLADPYGDQFRAYCEENPVNWRSGFCVLRFVNGRLMWPQLAHAFDEGKIDFQNEVWDV